MSVSAMYRGFVLVLLLTPACGGSNATGAVKDGTVPSEGGIFDARADQVIEAGATSDAAQPDEAKDASTNAVTSCDWGVFNEGTLNIRAVGGGDMGALCSDAPCGFTFTVADHRLNVPTTVGDLWYFSLLGSATVGAWTISQLDFSISWGWDVSWRAGQQLNVLDLIRVLDCPSAGSDTEFPVQTQLSVRDASGALLLLSAPDVPLTANGQALLDPAFAPELSMAWVDLDCPVYQGPAVGPEGGGRRMIGIVVRDTATGNQAVASWGRNATLQIRGEPYVLSVNDGWVFADGRGCGRAALALYREGYLFRP